MKRTPLPMATPRTIVSWSDQAEPRSTGSRSVHEVKLAKASPKSAPMT